MRSSKKDKVLDIALSEEKFYFPGETIRGSVVVKPKSSIKVNPIIIKFSGAIFIAAKEKEVIPLFQISKQLDLKVKVLEAKQYAFPFEFVVPDNLPSAMDFGKNKAARINYKITAILDRPMMPESLCPKIEYPVLVLEYVDVTKGSYVKVSEKQKESVSVSGKKCHVKLSVPRTGFTRGETIPVKIIVNTFTSFSKKESLVVDLIRKVKIQTARNTMDEEHILKSNKFDLNIIGPYNFTQSITSQLLIRTTPPTIRYKDRVLRVHYKIRVQVYTTDTVKKSSPMVLLELPIVIGTWPRADVPIDDDDDDDIIQNMGEVMISDDEDDDWMEQQEALEFKRHSNSSFYAPVQPIRRSGSNNSSGSINSRRFSVITLNSNKPTSPTSINSNNNNNNNSNIPSSNRNTLPPPVPTNSTSNSYLNRSCSTPDLLSNPPPQPPPQPRTNARVIDPTIRTSYYENSTNRNSSSNTNSSNNMTLQMGHRPSKSFSSNNAYFNNNNSNIQQHRRVGSDEFNHSYQQQIPNQTLQFLSSTAPPLTSPPSRIITEVDISSSSENDDSDDDLFAIIEKKKKRLEREQRKRQMYTVTE